MKRRHIFQLCLALLLCCPLLLQAQSSQTKYQYWIDNNKDEAVYGTANGEDISLNIDVGSLPPGIHFYNVRAYETVGTKIKWGTLYRYLFCIPTAENESTPGDLQSYEYWLDNDYEHRVSAVASGAENVIQLNVDVSTLASGIHFYNIRALDKDGIWGSTQRYVFSIPTTQQETTERLITGYTYAFDDNTPTSVVFDTPVTEYTLNKQIEVPSGQPPMVIDDDCGFIFDEDENTATLNRNVNVAFSLIFKDESGAICSPVTTNFVVQDVLTEVVQPITCPGTVTIDSHANGGFSVIRIDVEGTTTLKLQVTGACNLRLYSPYSQLLDSYDETALTASVTREFEEGIYYAVVYGNTEEVTLSLAGEGEPCGYAILDSETGTLTFKYGIMPNGDNVWETENTDFNYNNPAPWATEALKKVVFDTSYAEARPTSTKYWFSCASKLTEITDLQYLNTSNVTTMYCMFYECSSLTSLDVSHFDTGNVTDMVLMFDGCSSLTSLDLSHFETGNVTDMHTMFSSCSALTNLDLSHFDTSNVTNMHHMFEGCSSLTSLNLSHFETGNVKNMGSMFSRCSSLTSLDLSHFDTGNVTNMDFMFWDCSSLTSLDVSKFNTSNVKSMYWMFMGCKSLTSLDVSHFDTSNVTDMGSMFSGCSCLTSLDVSHFETGNVKDMESMFSYCTSLTSLDVSHFDTRNVTELRRMFRNCSNLTSLDLSHFDTRNVASFGLGKEKAGYSVGGMFQGCESLTSLDLSSFNTAKAESMGFMFQGCSNLKTIYVGEGWTTENVIDSDKMFENCIALVGCAGTVYDSNHTDVTYARVDGGNESPGYLSVKNYVPPVEVGYAVLSEDGTLTFKYGFKPKDDNVWETENTDFGTVNSAPWVSENLKKVIFDASYAEARPISTAKWFLNANNLTEILGLEYLNTSNVTDMSSMFYACRSLTALDLSNFDTHNVVTFGGEKESNFGYVPGMFTDCDKLTVLDLSSFSTAKVKTMNVMFSECWNLETIYVGEGWTSENVTESNYMFRNCPKLVGGKGTKYNANYVDKTYARIDGGTSAPGYFTSKSPEQEETDYAIFDSETGTLTFKYGVKPEGENVYPTIYDMAEYKKLYGDGFISPWHPVYKELKTVVFDKSYSVVRPKSMEMWFAGFSPLTIIGLENLNTSEVENMSYLFWDCSSLTEIDLSHFDTRNVTDMSGMFSECSDLKTIYVGDQWSTASVTDGRYMFYDCTSLVGSAGTRYDSGHIDHTYAHIDGGTRNPGYFSKRIDVNEDNVLDAKDITDLIAFIAGKSPNGVTVASADVNSDGKVDIADVIMVASTTLSK
ncbi:MAG: BspA family leucine-rich repeat surface protein [Prevotella sp.]|nr:BspA family leucine-rich repeat surface protein [Prevotella sp.]